jgi:hypothetical protein
LRRPAWQCIESFFIKQRPHIEKLVRNVSLARHRQLQADGCEDLLAHARMAP